ncbi:hypothetical protein J4Q44_G00085940 [Coregonus suidteri]|uniref:Cytohesin Ubiquitin Protein Inducing domain-containing protein n=1 Tax=Coregonus suidteri TaxID=861788 RepID=A0AAN8R375_9TELE
MEVKGRLITSMGVGAPDQDSKLQAERISALQERKQLLEDLLSSRVGELRQVCLLEAVSSSFLPFNHCRAQGKLEGMAPYTQAMI